MVQVEEDTNSARSNTPISPTLPASPAQTAPSVSAFSSPSSRRRGVFVEPVDEIDEVDAQESTDVTPQVLADAPRTISNVSPLIQSREEPPDYLAERQRQLEEMWRAERLQTAQETPQVKVENKRREENPSASAGLTQRAEIILPENSERDEGALPPNISANPAASFASTGGPTPAVNENANLSKIEGFYRRQQGSDGPPSPKLPAWKRWGSSFLRSKRTLTGVAVLAIVTITIFSSVLVVRADMNTVQREYSALMQDLENGRFTSARERVQVLTKAKEPIKPPVGRSSALFCSNTR